MQMAQQDQAVRNARPLDISRIGDVDQKNTQALKEIIDKVGWPFASLVGADGERAAWLLVQHADQDKDFQRKVLKLLEDAVRLRKTESSYYAYLYDRLHRPQRYGTQGKCVAEGRWEPDPIEDSSNVDKRRAEMGLPALAAYRKDASAYGCKAIRVDIPLWPGT